MSTYRDFTREPSAPHQCMHASEKDGRRCKASAMHNTYMCYHHRIEDLPTVVSNDPFLIEHLEDRNQIQKALADVASRLACNRMDLKRAGLLLYNLQVASSNLDAKERALAALAAATPTPQPATALTTEPIKMPEATTGDQDRHEDQTVVGSVDQSGSSDGLGLHPDEGQHQRDPEQDQQDRPDMRILIGMHQGEQETGDDCGEEERQRGQGSRGLPARVGVVSSGQAQPVIGDGERRHQEAPEADLLEDRREQRTEESSKPCRGRREEEFVDGRGLGRTDEVRSPLGHSPQQQPQPDQLGSLAACGGPPPLQSVEERPVPYQRIEHPRREESREIGSRKGGELQLGMLNRDRTGLRGAR